MITLAGYGEDPLVAALLSRLPETVRSGSGIVAGAGDDCAVIRPHGGAGIFGLLKTDCVIEGVHYLADTPPEKVGWKALCRPLSDIAAMGGRPLYALVTLLLPGTAELAYAEAIYDGLGRAAERFGVKIVGGETARSPGAGVISVALTGEVIGEAPTTRSGGKPGDLIYVTGMLGGSFLSGKHLDFVPRLAEARWLVSRFSVTAMMDLSDGLGRILHGSSAPVTPDVRSIDPFCRLRPVATSNKLWETARTTNCCSPSPRPTPQHWNRCGRKPGPT